MEPTFPRVIQVRRLQVAMHAYSMIGLSWGVHARQQYEQGLALWILSTHSQIHSLLAPKRNYRMLVATRLSRTALRHCLTLHFPLSGLRAMNKIFHLLNSKPLGLVVYSRATILLSTCHSLSPGTVCRAQRHVHQHRPLRFRRSLIEF